MVTSEREGVFSYLDILVVKQTDDEVNIVRFMFILSVIRKSEDDVVVREPPRVRGGKNSYRWLLALWKH